MAVPPRSGGLDKRVFALLVILAVLLLGFSAAIVATAGSRSASNRASGYHPRRTIPNTDVNPWGANVFLAQEVEEWKLDKTLRMAQDAGIGWIKQQFAWEEIEPEKGKFLVPGTTSSSWAKYDKIVELSEKAGLQIIARVDRPPAWAQPAANSGKGPIANYDDYGDFVYTLAKRYSGRIRYLQIWNEPNLYYEWGGVEPSARDYVALLRLAYRRAKEADPNIIIVSAPLAPTLERSVRALSDLDYLQQMYDQGAKGYFDILGANAFGQAFPPEDPPDPNRLNFQRVVLLRRIMEKNGDSGKAVWINEYGWNAAPADFAPEALPWARVSEQTQADYTIRGMHIARQDWDWAGVICVWYLRQVGNISPDNAEYYFRMVDVDFTPRPVYRAVKSEATAPAPSSGYFEETNPSVHIGPGWRYELASPASGGQVVAANSASGDLTIAFQGSSLNLVTEREPGAGSLYVSIDGQPANALPLDRSGRAVLDLANPSTKWQVESAVAKDLRQGQHVAQITRGPQSGRVNLDAFVVGGPTSKSSRGPAAVMGLFGLAIAGDLALIWREARKR
jgi:polysaccharide biosynthesis protein PslG